MKNAYASIDRNDTPNAQWTSVEAGAHDDQNAGEADEDCDHAPPPDPFTKDRPRERRDHERREKCDSDSLIEAADIEPR